MVDQGRADRRRSVGRGEQQRQGTLICSQCGREARPGARFCGACGAPLPTGPTMVCEECGAPIGPDDVFCANCGHRV
ncbi:MAG: zinc ribbon domain-containing protein [Anaerolineae bacterium]